MVKLTKLFFALTLIAFMSACSSDDNDDSTELEGTWNAISFSFDVNASTEASGQTTESTVSALGSNFDYSVVFTSDAFTTSGGYDIQTSGTSGTVTIPSTSSTYTDVDGSGTYSTSGDEITLNGSFYSFDYNGAPYTAANGPQTANYEINSDGRLIISQNETMTTTTSGVTSTTTIVSSSTWEKQ